MYSSLNYDGNHESEAGHTGHRPNGKVAQEVRDLIVFEPVKVGNTSLYDNAPTQGF